MLIYAFTFVAGAVIGSVVVAVMVCGEARRVMRLVDEFVEDMQARRQ